MSLIFKKSTAQPNFDVAATISGTLEATQELTCSWTVVRARDRNVTCRWYRHTADDGSDPAGVQIATGTTYTLTGTDVGNYIRAIVTAINPAGTVQSTTAYTAVITSGDPPTPPTIATAAAITGTANVGETLTVTADFDGETSTTYQWYSYTTEPTGSPLAGDGEVALGTASTQLLTASEAGRWIVAVVTATNAAGSAVTSASVAMAGVDSWTPAMPTEYAVPAYSLPTGGTTWTPMTSSEFRAALVGCQRGDVIVLDADTTYTGRFDIPAKSGEGWIYVISSRMANLPGDGERVVCGWEATRQGVSDNSVDMPTLQFSLYGSVSAGNRHGIWFGNGGTAGSDWYGSSYWRFCGLEMDIQLADTNIQYSMVQIQGSNIIFDRCYLHGSNGDAKPNRDGFMIREGGPKAIVGCHISDFKGVTSGGSLEAHAIHVFFGGNVVIENNFISSSSIPIFIGDNIEPAESLRNNDIVIRGNHIYKPNFYNRLSPEWDGINHMVKNMLEVKTGSRILIEGNLFENSYQGADQSGAWVYFKPAGGAAPVSDITCRNNVAYECNNWATATDSGVVPTRILFKNNLCYKIGGRGVTTTSKYWWYIQGAGTYVTIENNTAYYPDRTLVTGLWIWNNRRYTDNAGNYFRVRNNVLTTGTNYDFRGGSGPNGQPAMDEYCGDDMFYTNNVLLFGRSGSAYTNYPGAYEAGAWDSWYLPGTLAAVGFQDTAFNSVDDFELSVASSYATAGTGGSRPGIVAGDITAVLNDAFPT